MQGGLATMADEDQDSRRNDVLPSANGEEWPMHHEGGGRTSPRLKYGGYRRSYVNVWLRYHCLCSIR